MHIHLTVITIPNRFTAYSCPLMAYIYLHKFFVPVYIHLVYTTYLSSDA